MAWIVVCISFVTFSHLIIAWLNIAGLLHAAWQTGEHEPFLFTSAKNNFIYDAKHLRFFIVWFVG